MSESEMNCIYELQSMVQSIGNRLYDIEKKVEKLEQEINTLKDGEVDG